MKNMRVKDLGITKRRKGVKNGKNIGAASRISVAYRLPVSAKLKLVEISNALGLSETAAFVELITSFNELSSYSFFPLIFGLITSFLSSLFSIYFLLNYFSSNGLKLFVLYRVVFGVVILLHL